jgi:hypothetical protein
MNLIFRHKGRLRQGDEFIHYSTGDVSRPLVYVSQDGGEAFLVSRALTGAFSVRALSPRQWMQVRAKYHIAPVGALASSGACLDASMGDMAAEQMHLETDRVPLHDRQQVAGESTFAALAMDDSNRADDPIRHSPEESGDDG